VRSDANKTRFRRIEKTLKKKNETGEQNGFGRNLRFARLEQGSQIILVAIYQNGIK
jgi:hypothetical protein